LRNADDGAVLVESGSDEDLRNELGRSLDDFLLKYGHRSGDGSGFAGLSWFGNPEPVLAMVRTYARTDSPDPAEEHASLITERDRLIAIARSKLEGYPHEVRVQFDRALLLAQQSSRLQEDHAFWIDQQSLVRTHYVAMEVGRRLARSGVIDDPVDVFRLRFDEILNALDGLMSGDIDDKSDVIRDRVADLEYWSEIQGPLEIGIRPETGPTENVSSRGVTRFFGDQITQGMIRRSLMVFRLLPGVSKVSPGSSKTSPSSADFRRAKSWSPRRHRHRGPRYSASPQPSSLTLGVS
jgi:pyruvate,water dikinase